jgi:hypothetical protein
MTEMRLRRTKWRAGLGMAVATLLTMVFSLAFSLAFCLRLTERPVRAADQPGAECLACHGDKTMTTTRAGKTGSLFVDALAAGFSMVL